MNLEELDYFLREENEIEKKQKINGESFMENEIKSEMELGMNFNLNDVEDFVMSKKLFFKKGNIHISKHNRYARMVQHSHEFVEINYMYSGRCKQIINEEEIILEEGDICLLDKDIKHEISVLGENDILINILLKSETINTEILKNMAINRSILTEFLLYASQDGNFHSQFLLFRIRKNKKIQDIIKNILLEYYSDSIYSMQIIQLTLPILFIELSINYNEDLYCYREEGNKLIIEALKIIEEKYKTMTLGDLAYQLGFNKNYLGNLLKKETGQTFSKLVLKQRLLNAYQLVINTNFSMEEIANKVGLKSTSYFFRIFKEQFKENPGELRAKIKNCK